MDFSKLTNLSNYMLIALMMAVRKILAQREVNVAGYLRKALREGDVVSFYSEKRDGIIEIQVNSIGPRNVTGINLRTGENWRVGPAQLMMDPHTFLERAGKFAKKGATTTVVVTDAPATHTDEQW